MIRVREGLAGIWIDNGKDSMFIAEDTFGAPFVHNDFLADDCKVVYERREPLKVGQRYTSIVIDENKTDMMIVVGYGTGYAYQYIGGLGWFSGRVSNPQETLPGGRFTLLSKGTE